MYYLNILKENPIYFNDFIDRQLKNRAITLKDEPDRLLYEKSNLEKVYVDLFDGGLESEFSIPKMHEIHNIITNGKYTNGFRRTEVMLPTTGIKAPEPFIASQCVSELVYNYSEYDQYFSPIENIARFTIRFCQNHPYEEGNGRTSRFIINYLLLKYDLPPISTEPKRSELIDAVCNENIKKLASLINELCNDELNILMEITGKKPKNMLNEYNQYIECFWESSKIEGHSLSLEEYKNSILKYIEERKTNADISEYIKNNLSEHSKIFDEIDAINHYEIFEVLFLGKKEMTVTTIKQINEYINRGILDNGGQYRKTQVEINGEIPIAANMIPFEIQKLVYEKDLPSTDKLYNELAMHIAFEKLHPFEDGNGRTGRLLLNLDLMKQGLKPIMIRSEDKEEYFSYIKNNDPVGLYGFVTEEKIKKADTVKTQRRL